MATNWHSETIDSYLEALGSGAPTPGGGAAAGLTGAQACALAEMAASLTMSNQKYAALHEDAAHWKDLCRTGRSILLSLMDEDAKNFTALMEAVRLPKDKDGKNEAREIVIQSALKKAIEAPAQMAGTLADLLPLFTLIMTKGNQNAVTDSIIAVETAQAALRACFLNIRINLKYIHDEFYTSDMEESIKQWTFAIDQADALLTYQVRL